MFIHQPLQYQQLTASTQEDKRIYHTPIGPLESVTTILSKYTDKTYLEQWKERIGHQAATEITHQAGFRGSSVHDLAEKYLNNDPAWDNNAMPVNTHSFKKIRPFLENVNIVYGTEVPLWSRFLHTAGRCDLICQYNNKNTILDFKTSKRPKEEDHILNYFMQATAYSLMTLERFELFCPQIAILIAVDHHEPQLFVSNINKYFSKTIDVFKRNYNDSRKHSKQVAISL